MKLGAEVQGLGTLGNKVAGESRRLQSSIQAVDGMVRSIWWQGNEADRFRSMWSGALKAKAQAALTTLEDAVRNVKTQAEQQRRASEVDNNGSGGGAAIAPGTGAGSGGGGTAGGGAGGGGTSGGGAGGGGGSSDTGKTTWTKEHDANGRPIHSTSTTSGAYASDGRTGAYKVSTHEDTSTAHGRQIKHSGEYAVGDANKTGKEFTDKFGDQKDKVRPSVHLAGGDATATAGYDRSAQGTTGFAGGTASGHARVLAGADATAGYSAGIDNGKLKVGASGEVFAGAKAEAGGTYQNGILTTTAGGTAMVGAQAKGDAGVSVGPDGVDASAGGEAFVGGKADANASVDVGGVEAGGHAGVSYGLGANFDAGASFSTHKVGVHFDVGATLGLGVNFGVDLSVNPSEVAHTVTDFGKGALHGGEVVSALNPCD